MNRMLLCLALVVPSVWAADLTFDSTFSSGMVLQRDAALGVTGHGPAGARLRVSLGPQSHEATVAADGSWKVDFDPLPAGGPHILTATDGRANARIEDVLVGDIWVCSGQSNMQMGLEEAQDGPAAIAAGAKDSTIRLLSVPKAAADKPQTEIGATWRRCDGDSLRKFSAVGFFFAHHLHQDPELAKIPLGLIDSSFGGTSIEAWTPPGTLPDIPKDQISGSMFGIPSGGLFNRMIHPLTSLPIKGVVWYQGEANAGRPAVYAQLLGNMVGRWRAQWRDPGLPFLIVQLPAFEGRMDGLDFGWLREAQARACESTPKVWLALTHDTTDGSDLHPREKQEIGRRLALLARREVFGENLIDQGPRQTKVEVASGRMVVTFDQMLKSANGQAVRGFALAGADGDYRFAKAEIDGSKVALEAEGVPQPLTVRYAWGGLPEANLSNESGLPAWPFRTDTQSPQSVAFQPLPAFQRLETLVYQLETGRGGRIASLVIRGKQFLSNEPNGGALIPTFFGPRQLSAMTALGPGRMVFSDNEAEIELACREDSMEWTLRNKGGNPFDYQIALSPLVKVATKDRATTLAREDVVVVVEGVEADQPGGRLVAKLPAHQTTIIRWKSESPRKTGP